MRLSMAICAMVMFTGSGPDDVRVAGDQTPGGQRPNIVLAIADDWSYPHARVYGDSTVSTPTFDRIAREGVLFTHAFTAAPSCTPSRAALLTGQVIHRLEEGADLHGFLPKRFAVYPDLLEQAGYVVGYTGKGWGPGRFEPGGRGRNPAGPQFKSFDAFIQQRPAGRPFLFWFGSNDPHRPYEAGTGVRSGMTLDSVKVPSFLPDTPEVRSDLLDYYFEVQRFDRDVGGIVATLERLGELDNTLVIVTSDNGMPFPRAKATVYDAGARMPLAIRPPSRGSNFAALRRGSVVDVFVTHTDIAPTLLEAAGLNAPATMTGRSVLGLLRGASRPGLPSRSSVQQSVRPEARRDHVFIERERHAHVRRGNLSYPVRAIRTKDYLYVRNFRPDRWPAGDPQLVFSVGPFGDIDGGPTKSLLIDRQDDPTISRYFRLATAKRPAEELYDLKNDPHQLENVAGRPGHAGAQHHLRQLLDAWLHETGDPRVTTDDDRWDRFPYYGEAAK
jgi:N-sulfoglucosamine sulfohydrolase